MGSRYSPLLSLFSYNKTSNKSIKNRPVSQPHHISQGREEGRGGKERREGERRRGVEHERGRGTGEGRGKDRMSRFNMIALTNLRLASIKSFKSSC